MGGKLRMYNVEFGDAFLLYGQGENLLVDLGSIQNGFPFSRVRDSIKDESREKELSLLLTHFHEDHWSGLHNQTPGHQLPGLKMVYLPDIFRMRVLGEVDVIVQSLLSDFLEAVVLNKRLRFTLADLLREILPGLQWKQIRFLRRGDKFLMGGRNYEVLWPRLNREDVVMKRKRPLLDVLNRLDVKTQANGREVGLLDTLEAIASVLLRDFGRGVDYPVLDIVPDYDRTYGSLYNQAQELLEAITFEVRRDEGELRNKIRHYAKQLGNSWNQISLVFHDLAEEDDVWEYPDLPAESLGRDGVLMTGDAPSPILDKLRNGTFAGPRLRESYAVIKAPHHGTKSYFCAILPHCRYLCVSNGEGNKNYQKISEYYEYEYRFLSGKTEIFCTNPRCDFIKKRRLCPYFSTRPVSQFYDVSW